jgi:hypothetical protein
VKECFGVFRVFKKSPMPFLHFIKLLNKSEAGEVMVVLPFWKLVVRQQNSNGCGEETACQKDNTL